MNHHIKQNFENIRNLITQIEASNRQGKMLIFEEAVEKVILSILEKTDAGGQILFIGNGGSAAIASHMATDFWKNIGLKAMAFNDSVLLTCISNDHGYKYVFEKSIETFGTSSDILIAISSSGRSENILRGVQAAQAKGITVITLSGFKPDNPLRTMGHINFYVPESNYGHVECTHHILCHSFINVILSMNSKMQEKAVLYE